MTLKSSACLIIFIIITKESSAVSVLSEHNKLDPVKPSPVDENNNEKPPDKFVLPVVDSSENNKFNKRENVQKGNEKFTEDNKNDERSLGRITERGKNFIKNISAPLRLNCCGNRFESGGRNGESGTQLTTRASDIHRYPERLNRPDDRDRDRYNWHASSGRPGISSTTSDVYGNIGGNGDRRHGTRPPFGNYEPEYPRPGYGGRPGYGYGYGGYGDTGAHGSHGHEVGYRPGSIFFPGHKRPFYGIHGILGGQEEIPDSGEGETTSSPPTISNIQTQKAVALKALAGVALIGAAAALAANPALIPAAAVLHGRKRRSTEDETEFNLLNFPEQFIKHRMPDVYQNDETAKQFWDSPKCVARLTCEVQKEYVKAITKNPNLRKDVQRRIGELIDSEIFSADYVFQSLQMLTKIARKTSDKDGKCEIFTCNFFL